MNVILTLVLLTFLCHLHHGDCRPLKVKRDEDHMTDALVSQRITPNVNNFELQYMAYSKPINMYVLEC